MDTIKNHLIVGVIYSETTVVQGTTDQHKDHVMRTHPCIAV